MPVVEKLRSLRGQWGYPLLLIPVSIDATFLAACEPSSEAEGQVAKGRGGQDALEMVIEGKSFSPETLELKGGRKVTVQIMNEDDMPHDFAIEELDLNTGTIEPGDAATATFRVPAGGTDFACTFHSEMTGRIEAR